MGKGFFSTLLMGVALLSAAAVVSADASEDDDGLHPLRTHSIYMPYIGKPSSTLADASRPIFSYFIAKSKLRLTE